MPDEDPGRERDSVARGATTVCPRCAVGCHLARGAASGGDGAGRDAGDSRAEGREGPSNPGGRLCAKGVRAFETLDDGDRITRPLVRRDGDLEPASWDDALARVVEGFESVLDERGPGGLAFLGAPRCTNEENYLLGKLARLLGTNDVDNRARLCHEASAGALADRLGWPATTNGLEDLAESDVVLVVGANPAERQPVAFDSFVRPAVNSGATLVHVDPVGNATTRLADVHLAPRPGRDALVLDLLSAGVLDADGADREFVAERTAGFDAFADALGDLDRDAAVAAAGVDPGTLDEVAGLVADADRVAAMVGTGIEGDDGGGDGGGGGAGGGGRSGDSGGDGDSHRSGDGGQPARAPGPDALLNLLLLTGNVGRPGTGVYLLRGLVNEQGATDAGAVPDRLPGHQPVSDPAARERVAAEWGVEPPAEPGDTAHDLLAAFGDRVRAALVVGENPAVSKRDPDWLRDRLDALDCLAVVDVAASETTPHADVVLPGAAGVETAGTVTNLDRRVQRVHPTAPPPGDARPDFRVLRDLGRRLVGGGQFDFEEPGDAFAELARVAPTHAGVAYADLDGAGRRWPFGEDDALYRDSFGTADGRAPFVPPASGNEVGDAAGATDAVGGRLQLVTGGRANDPDGPGGDDRALRVHPTDADERGIESGDDVVVSTDESAVEVTANRDESVRRGTVYLHAAVADPLLRDGGGWVDVETVRE